MLTDNLPRLRESLYCRFTKVDPISRRTDIQRIFNPLLKVTLPGDVEQEAGGPQEDDCHMTEVGGEVKPLLRHPIVAFKVVARIIRSHESSDLERVPKFWKFCCHRFSESSSS